jgi:hypothetical protein
MVAHVRDDDHLLSACQHATGDAGWYGCRCENASIDRLCQMGKRTLRITRDNYSYHNQSQTKPTILARLSAWLENVIQDDSGGLGAHVTTPCRVQSPSGKSSGRR